jgi:type IV secretion system protein VirD4
MITQVKYIMTATLIVLSLIVIEILIIHTLVAPDPFLLLMNPAWRTLYTTFAILLPIGIIGVFVWLWYVLTYTQPGTYGTAHFATRSELKRVGMKKLLPPGSTHLTTLNKQEESTFVLGISHSLQIALTEAQQENHVLLVAPTGRGKTAGIVIPNILNERGNRSLLVNDVKHELIEKCISAVAQYHDCYIIAPTKPGESNGYNPLAHVTPESQGDARSVAECIVRNTGVSKEPFWDNAARLLLTAVILHLRATEPEAAFSRIADICTKSLPEVADIITHSSSPLAKRLGSSFVKNVSVEPKLQSNIMTDLSTRLFDMMDLDVGATTAYDELNFERLGEQPSAIFLHIPPHEATRLKWLSSCFIMQLTNYLFERKHKQRFAFYLDELANIGYIPRYLEYISYIRSAGVAFLQVIQDFGQIERIYEQHGKDTLLANSGTKVFLSGVGQVEAEYASRVMGEKTVLARGESSEGEGHQGTISYTEAARKLMNPDEVRSLPMWTLLIFIGNMRPILAQNTPYFELPEMQARTNLPYIPPQRVLPDPLSKPTIIPPLAASQTLPQKSQRTTQKQDNKDYEMELGDPYTGREENEPAS